MKIISWNVNGVRAWLDKGAADWVLAQQPDVFLLQEIKARPEQLTNEQLGLLRQGYRDYWHPAVRPGYSGVATFSRQEPEEVRLGLGFPHYDDEGRVIASRHGDVLLFNIYFPNGQRDYGRLSYKLDFYADLLALCNQLHAQGEKIILTGDFNTAHREIDLRNPKENANTSGFMPEERAWIDRYLESGFVDIYRERFPERAQYTWWTYRFNARRRNIGWRLDYYLISAGLAERVSQVTIHDAVEGSDHCPVSIELEG